MHERLSHDPEQVFESEEEAAAVFLARRYAWALVKKREREMHIMEHALMCGKIDPEQLYRERGPMSQFDFTAQISNNLLTYQLVMFTLNAVNRRCKEYKRHSPAGFPPELNAIVRGYQGEAALPPWHGKAFIEICCTRVKVTKARGDEQEWTEEGVLPLPTDQDKDLIYSCAAPGFWALPWGG